MDKCKCEKVFVVSQMCRWMDGASLKYRMDGLV